MSHMICGIFFATIHMKFNIPGSRGSMEFGKKPGMSGWAGWCWYAIELDTELKIITQFPISCEPYSMGHTI